jgi:hypothetical protein
MVLSCSNNTKTNQQKTSKVISSKKQKVDKEKYYRILFKKIPEIIDKSKRIAKETNRKVRVRTYIDFSKTYNGFYPVKVYESHKSHAVTIWRFRINKNNFDILFYDSIKDTTIALEKWRSNKLKKNNS